LIKLEYQLKEKKSGSVRGSDNVSSFNGNEFDKQHEIVQETVQQPHEDFEDKNCTSVKNWLNPQHNTQNDRISKFLSRQIVRFELPAFDGDVKKCQLSSQHTIRQHKIVASQQGNF
jgi:hypothetical protein